MSPALQKSACLEMGWFSSLESSFGADFQVAARAYVQFSVGWVWKVSGMMGRDQSAVQLLSRKPFS